MEMDGIFDIVSIHQFPRHLFMALFMRRIGQERNEFLCLCGRLRMMMILPHVSSLIFPETGPALSLPSTHQPTIDEEEEEPSMEFYYQDIPSLFTRQVIFTSPICSNKCVCGYIWKGNRLLLAVGAMMIGPPSLLCLRLSRPYFIKTAQWRDKKRSTRISPDAITIGMLWNCLASEKKLFKLLITRRARIVKAEWLEGSNEGGKNTAAGRPSPSETHKNAAALTIHNSLSPGACVYIIIHFPAGPPLHLSTLFIFFFAKLKRNLICYRS